MGKGNGSTRNSSATNPSGLGSGFPREVITQAANNLRASIEARRASSPVNVDDYEFTNYRNSENGRPLRDEIRRVSDEIERAYTSLFINYNGNTPPDKEIDRAFDEVRRGTRANRDGIFGEAQRPSVEQGFKSAVNALDNRMEYLKSQVKDKNYRWDGSRRRWVTA